MNAADAARLVFRDPRLFAAALVVWTLLWLLAGVSVYRTALQLEDYGETTITAARGLDQTSRGLTRAGAGLRQTASALDDVPFVGGDLGRNVLRTASDVDAVAKTVRVTARQARTSGEETRDAAQGVAVVLGAAVAIVPTLPVVALALIMRALFPAREGRP